MRISDWSSDVGSSDLLLGARRLPARRPRRARAAADGGGRAAEVRAGQPARGPRRDAVVPQPSEGRIARHPRGAVLARAVDRTRRLRRGRSEEHTSELQSLMRTSYAVFCLKKKKHINHYHEIQ